MGACSGCRSRALLKARPKRLDAMGHVTAAVKICNPREGTRCAEAELIVDTGSTYTWIRRERLEAIGVRPGGVRRFKTIEGRVVEREVGEAVIECLGERATSIVVFAEESDVEVMGVVTLELLALEVDPAAGRLRKAESLLALTARLYDSAFKRADGRARG